MTKQGLESFMRVVLAFAGIAIAISFFIQEINKVKEIKLPPRWWSSDSLIITVVPFQKGDSLVPFQQGDSVSLTVKYHPLILLDSLRKQNTRIDSLLRELKKQQFLEKNQPKGSGFFFRHVQLEEEQSATRKLVNLQPSREVGPFRQYILPAIYTVLAVILLASSTVSLATRETSRKETATEMTKTLMSFFIGAATGKF